MRAHCWKCFAEHQEKIRFRSECDKCGAYLHCCKNCRYHSLGKPNDCTVPGTELILDREAFNFCEEFAPKSLSKEPEKTEKNRFNSLFD